MTRSSSTALQPLDPNVHRIKPSTPGKQVRNLKAELEKKDVENEALKKNIFDLNKALSGLTLAKNIVLEVTTKTSLITKKNAKDKDAPVPAKTAYKFFCEANPKRGVDMRQLWKESDPTTKQYFTFLGTKDKARYNEDMEKYEEEKVALEMYYAKKKEDTAMQFYEAHVAAQTARDNANAGKKNKKTTKDPDAPKRPTSSYFYFAADQRDIVKKNNPDASVTELSKILGEMWSKLEKGKEGKKGTLKYDNLAAKDKNRYAEEREVYDTMISKRDAESEEEKINSLNKDKKEALKLFNMFKNASDIVTSEVAETMGNSTNDDMSVVSEITTTPSISADSKKVKKKKDPNAPKQNISAYIYFCNNNRSRIVLPEGAKQTEVLTELGRQWKALSDEDKKPYKQMACTDKERYAVQMKLYNLKK